MAAVPQIGRATRVERPVAPGADAAGDLYERYSAQILGYCLHQLGSREEAEDAVQTTFMNAFRGLQRGNVPELESAWLFKIAHNVCLSRRRSSWRRGKIEAPNNFEVLQEIVPGREQVSDELIRLPEVLEEMPENQRRAILLREWQGLTYREISTELGLSQAAVETLIFRARRALAQGLEQDADTWKRRLRRGADVGGAIACIKALLGGGGAAAVKVAATALAVAATAMTAATEIPKHAHDARAQRPQAAKTARHLTRAHSAVATAAAASSSLAHRRATGPERRPNAGQRQLPKPVTSTPADEPIPTPIAATPPAAPAPIQAEPAVPPAASPSAQSPADGSGKKDDRSTQGTTQPTNPTPPLAADPPGPADPGNGNGNGHGNGNGKPDKPDGPNANASANSGSGNSNAAKGGDRPDKPPNDSGKGNEKTDK